MNKQEKIIVALLGILLAGTIYWQSAQNRKRIAEYNEYLATNTVEVAESPALPADTALSAAPTAKPEAAATPAASASAADSAAEPSPASPDTSSSLPETTAVLSNDVLRLTLTSKGGGIREAAMLQYRAAVDSPEDDVATHDFSDAPALSLDGVTGFGPNADFTIETAEDGRSATLTARRGDVEFVRTIAFATDDVTGRLPFYEMPLLWIERLAEKTDKLMTGYRLTVTDTFRNVGAAEALVAPERVRLGTMAITAPRDDMLYVGADARTVDPKGKTLYRDFTSQRFHQLFGGTAGGGCAGCGGAAALPPNAPKSASSSESGDFSWLAVRSRFFTQVLTPQTHFGALTLRATRTVPTDGTPASLESIAADAVVREAAALQPGAETSATYDFYIGPRRMANLRRLGQGQVRITHLGFWRIFCEYLLDLLNLFYAIIPNYGVAIILLTALVRLLMRPLTKRQNESMKRMNALQPKMKEIQELYKDDKQKLQRETMRLYQEYKVNPLSSCLPMLIQLPIFVAFFTMLRCAVELRFAPFLWISDLSMPENLFRDELGFGLNILPIAMCAAMYFQSKIMPSGGDPQQQRMMAIMMPAMMLVFFYTTASGLCLYWGTSTLFAIVGMWWQKRHMSANGGAADGVEVIAPPRETRQMRRAKDRA